MKRLLLAIIALSGAMAGMAQDTTATEKVDTTGASEKVDTIRVGGMIIIKKKGNNDDHHGNSDIVIQVTRRATNQT